MELSVINIKGQETGKKIVLNDNIFAIEPNDHAIYLDVKSYLANNRQGTSKSKEKSEVTASTKKIKKQKGTGTARAGSLKSPVFVGGGRVFGPKPRDYEIKLNKKVKQLARKSALAYKAKESSIKVIEDFNFTEPRTKELVTILNNLNLEKKSLLVLSEQNNNIYLSSRNLQNVKVLTVSQLNTYEILKYNNLMLLESSVEAIEKIFCEKE